MFKIAKQQYWHIEAGRSLALIIQNRNWSETQ